MSRAAVKLLCAALALALCWGCAPAAPAEDEGLKLWFPTQGRQLTAALDSCPYEGEATVPSMLDALLAGPPVEETGLAAAIPPGTRVLSSSSWTWHSPVLRHIKFTRPRGFSSQ